jgi:hypothetical protein
MDGDPDVNPNKRFEVRRTGRLPMEFSRGRFSDEAFQKFLTWKRSLLAGETLTLKDRRTGEVLCEHTVKPN